MEIIEENYRQHPYFKFNEAEHTLNEVAFSEFNKSYELAKKFHLALDEDDFTHLRGLCHEQLNLVFDDLERQSEDEFIKLFYQELRQNVARILNTELDTYWSARFKYKTHITGSEQINNLLNLENFKHYFSRVPLDVVNEINSLGTEEMKRFRENVKNGRLTREDLSTNNGPAIKKMVQVLRRAFDENGTNEIVSAYMGKKMSVTGMAYELSVPEASWWKNGFTKLPRDPSTMYAHLDEALMNPKSIVYLSDVELGMGATACYPELWQSFNLQPMRELVGRVIGDVGLDKSSKLHAFYQRSYHQSTTSENFRKHFMKLPTKIRFNSHMGWDVMPDSNLEKLMVQKEISMTGPAGTNIVFDGARLFHRGGLVAKKERIALQVVFDEFSLSGRVFNRLRRLTQ